MANKLIQLKDKDANALYPKVLSNSIPAKAVSSDKLADGVVTTINNKVDKTTKVNGHALTGDVTVTKADVGLNNVDNTTDATKSVKYAVNAGTANAVAWNNVSGKPSSYTPSSHSHDYVTFIGNHAETASGTTGNAYNTGMAKSSGLFLTGTYGDNATPASYGNIINAAGAGSGQLLLEWSGSDNTTGNLYYRSHRDTSSGGWGAWKQIAYTTDLTWRNISGRPSSMPASDVAAWAKAASKPSYSWGEISGKPSTFTPAGHKQAYTAAELTDYTTDGNTYGVSPAGVRKAFTIFEPKAHSHSTATWTPKTDNRNYQVAFSLGSQFNYDNGEFTYNPSTNTLNVGNVNGNIAWGNVTGKPSTYPPSSHNHNYLPLSGGTLSGSIDFGNSGTSIRGIKGTVGDNDAWRVVGGATAVDEGYLEIATADGATEPIYVRQYGYAQGNSFSTIKREVVLLGKDGNTSFPGTVKAAAFNGKATSASSADSATTAKSIQYGDLGSCFIGKGSVDAANGVGGALNNIIINSWFGVSFTTTCNSPYKNKTAVGIDCRNSIVYASQFRGSLVGNASSATNDGSGRNIVNTYATKAELNSKITYVEV